MYILDLLKAPRKSTALQITQQITQQIFSSDARPHAERGHSAFCCLIGADAAVHLQGRAEDLASGDDNWLGRGRCDINRNWSYLVTKINIKISC